MDLTSDARREWQRAQAELQMALAALERGVADGSAPEEILDLRSRVTAKQQQADEMLNRYITQVGKS